jgi:hypothetical protein
MSNILQTKHMEMFTSDKTFQSRIATPAKPKSPVPLNLEKSASAHRTDQIVQSRASNPAKTKQPISVNHQQLPKASLTDQTVQSRPANPAQIKALQGDSISLNELDKVMENLYSTAPTPTDAEIQGGDKPCIDTASTATQSDGSSDTGSSGPAQTLPLPSSSTALTTPNDTEAQEGDGNSNGSSGIDSTAPKPTDPETQGGNKPCIDTASTANQSDGSSDTGSSGPAPTLPLPSSSTAQTDSNDIEAQGGDGNLNDGNCNDLSPEVISIIHKTFIHNIFGPDSEDENNENE